MKSGVLYGTPPQSNPKILVRAHMRNATDKGTTRSDNTHNSLKDQKKRCANTSKIKKIKNEAKKSYGGVTIEDSKDLLSKGCQICKLVKIKAWHH